MQNEAVATGEWVPVIRVDKLLAGQMIGLELGDLKIAIYNVAGQFYATANVCTHQYALLTEGWLDGTLVECPLHGGQFDVTCGRALDGIVDCNLQTYAIREVDGLIQILV